MFATFCVLAYFTPETVLPVTSVIATVVGGVLMFSRVLFRLIVRGVHKRRSPHPEAMKPVVQDGGRSDTPRSEEPRP